MMAFSFHHISDAHAPSPPLTPLCPIQTSSILLLCIPTPALWISIHISEKILALWFWAGRRVHPPEWSTKQRVHCKWDWSLEKEDNDSISLGVVNSFFPFAGRKVLGEYLLNHFPGWYQGILVSGTVFILTAFSMQLNGRIFLYNVSSYTHSLSPI